jgi:hypothetical protein
MKTNMNLVNDVTYKHTKFYTKFFILLATQK